MNSNEKDLQYTHYGAAPRGGGAPAMEAGTGTALLANGF